MERHCRVCDGWHSLEEAWPYACKNHFVSPTARSDIPSPLLIRDIEPYQSMVTGEMISGRRQHRDHLKAHGCIEVGNEAPPPARKTAALKTSRREKLSRQLGDMSDRQANRILKQLKKELHV